MPSVFTEANPVGNLVGPVANFRAYTQVSQCGHHGGVKVGDRLRLERKSYSRPVTGFDAKHMVDEIKVDLKNPLTGTKSRKS